MDTKGKNISLKALLFAIGLGIWVIVLQNAGIIPTKQNVYVKGGKIDADVSGSVSIDNTVDINIEAVNGHKDAFYGPSKDGSYDALHVYTGK
ncbi:hypothetical protein [Flavihumibacter sp.]|uniref:hypothetical protein n=1 Tax=Flavihumibacter sp. TaxID=1913981 RepID=UPI002FC675AA